MPSPAARTLRAQTLGLAKGGFGPSEHNAEIPRLSDASSAAQALAQCKHLQLEGSGWSGPDWREHASSNDRTPRDTLLCASARDSEDRRGRLHRRRINPHYAACSLTQSQSRYQWRNARISCRGLSKLYPIALHHSSNAQPQRLAASNLIVMAVHSLSIYCSSRRGFYRVRM